MAAAATTASVTVGYVQAAVPNVVVPPAYIDNSRAGNVLSLESLE